MGTHSLDLIPTVAPKPKRGRPRCLESETLRARILACARYREAFGATEAEAARQFKVTPRTVRRWRRALKGSEER